LADDNLRRNDDVGGAWVLFFKVDADGGFNHVVMDADSIDRTGFAMFHLLWVTVRMNFRVISGPATFA